MTRCWSGRACRPRWCRRHRRSGWAARSPRSARGSPGGSRVWRSAVTPRSKARADSSNRWPAPGGRTSPCRRPNAARPAGVPHPLDRVADEFGLGAIEVNLLLLAAMPEEHEGYASVLRTLNPRGEARVAVGLAAQLLCRDADERLALREALLDGNALRQGIVALAGDGALFERNLILAPGLWPVLGGLDHWPDELQPIALGAATAGLEDWFAEPTVARAARALQRRHRRMLVVSAEAEALAADRAAALCAHAGLQAVGFDAPATPAAARLAGVHALARGRIPDR